MEHSLAAATRRAALQGGPGRRPYRHKILPLAYTTVDEGNGGILCDLSAQGAGIHTISVLNEGHTVRLRFRLLNPKLSLDVQAQVRWSNALGQAGLRFVHLEPHLQRGLKDWIFRDLLARVIEDGVWQRSEQVAPDLVLSPTARSAIVLGSGVGARVEPAAVPTPPAQPGAAPGSSISHRLADLMDGLVLCCAVLLFFVIFLTVSQSLPSWPVAAAIVAGVAAFCALLYWGVIARIGGGTAGARLTKIGIEDAKTGPREHESRFR
jgi:hypothetical protein